MSDDPPVTDLVTRAAAGDKQAWDALVERYAPLVWSICRRHRLAGWLDKLRRDPSIAALIDAGAA
jgi:DNA-directed RNA polymerase specialized sigma subunit